MPVENGVIRNRRPRRERRKGTSVYEVPPSVAEAESKAERIKEIIQPKNWQDHVISDPRFLRTTETGATVADPSKAQRALGWSPN